VPDRRQRRIALSRPLQQILAGRGRHNASAVLAGELIINGGPDVRVRRHGGGEGNCSIVGDGWTRSLRHSPEVTGNYKCPGSNGLDSSSQYVPPKVTNVRCR
jgi:hypothetical protein